MVACAERDAPPHSALRLPVSVLAWALRLSGASDSAGRAGGRLGMSVDGLVGKKGFQQLGQRFVPAG